MGTEPQHVIRRYLDEHGGQVDVPAHNLLRTWQVADFGAGNAERIEEELRDAGIETQPVLGEVARDTTVTLRLRDQEADQPPPWMAERGGDQISAERTVPADPSEPDESPPVEQHPAGWYQDPHQPARLRWWDGSRWTENIHGQAVPAQDTREGSAAGSAASTPRQQKPWYRRTWVIVTAVVVGLLVLGGILGAAQEQPSDEEPAREQAREEEPAGTPSGDASEDRGDCPNDPGKPNEATDECTPRVGADERVTVDGLVYSITSARTATSLGDPTIGTGETADGVFVIVKLRVQSTKGEAVTLTGDTVKLVARGAAEYSPDTEGSTAALLAGGEDADEPFFLEEIQPDTATSGTIVYDVPPSLLARKPSLRFNELAFGTTHALIRLPRL